MSHVDLTSSTSGVVVPTDDHLEAPRSPAQLSLAHSPTTDAMSGALPDTAPTPSLARRLLAESVGTALLVAVVVGSGIAAQQLSPGNAGLQLLENSTATVFGLAVLILMFGPVSGAHFNPVVTGVLWVLKRRDDDAPPVAHLAGYVAAQAAGAIAGSWLANAMFSLPTWQISTHERSGAGLWLGEVVATGGLIALILTLGRTARDHLAPAAVAAFIGAAYWFTSSTSFANPAVTLGRVFSDTFAGIAPGSVPGFVLAQIAGAVLGAALVLALHPSPRGRTETA